MTHFPEYFTLEAKTLQELAIILNKIHRAEVVHVTFHGGIHNSFVALIYGVNI